MRRATSLPFSIRRHGRVIGGERDGRGQVWPRDLESTPDERIGRGEGSAWRVQSGKISARRPATSGEN
jgi:hypothetical protein